MKALSVKQPWAGLIALGEKTLEVRSWKTNYKGPLVIVSSQSPDRKFMKALKLQDVDMDHPLIKNGVTLCVVDLVAVRHGEHKDTDAAFCDPRGYFVWVLENPRLVQRRAVKGQLGLYEIKAPRRSYS